MPQTTLFHPVLLRLGEKLLHSHGGSTVPSANQNTDRVWDPTVTRNGASAGGPTVKDILSSFTERMRASLDLSMTLNERTGQVGEGFVVPPLELEKLDEESLSTGELSSTQDTSEKVVVEGVQGEEEGANTSPKYSDQDGASVGPRHSGA